MADAVVHTLQLTNGMAIALLQLATARGLLTKAVHVRKVSQFAREHLRDTPEFSGNVQETMTWADTPFKSVEIKERTRDALKALMTTALEKGALSCGIGEADLLAAFGLGDED